MINAIIVVGTGLIYFDICNNIIRRVIKKTKGNHKNNHEIIMRGNII